MNRNTEWEDSLMVLDYALATAIVSAKIRLIYSSVLCCFFGDLVTYLLTYLLHGAESFLRS